MTLMGKVHRASLGYVKVTSRAPSGARDSVIRNVKTSLAPSPAAASDIFVARIHFHPFILDRPSGPSFYHGVTSQEVAEIELQSQRSCSFSRIDLMAMMSLRNIKLMATARWDATKQQNNTANKVIAQGVRRGAARCRLDM